VSGGLLDEISDTAASVAIAVVPLAVLFLVFQAFLLKLPRRQVIDLLTGTAIAACGLFLFLLGIGTAFLPFGRAIGAAIGALDAAWQMAAIGLLLGFITAWAEPAVRVLANEVESASNGSIRRRVVLYAICIGVAVWVALGMLRISFGIPLLYLVVPGYLVVIALLWFSDQEFLAIAVDAGGVATGPLSNSFLLALGLGAATAAGGRDPLVEGFGLAALIALAPIISVMALGLLVRYRSRPKE
jgi:hypothetical protein